MADAVVYIAPPTLQNCADEPIHVPGTILPHGAMLVFGAGGLLEAWSENAIAMLHLLPRLGQTVQQVSLPAPVLALVEACMDAIASGEALPLSREVDFGTGRFDCILRAHAIRMTTDVIARILAASVQALEAHARMALIERAPDMRTALMHTRLLGEDTLREVARHAQFICTALDASALIVSQSGRHVVHGAVDAATARALLAALPEAGEVLRERVHVNDWPEAARAHIQRWPGMLAMCFDPSTEGWVVRPGPRRGQDRVTHRAGHRPDPPRPGPCRTRRRR